jgi:hypothetical protein
MKENEIDKRIELILELLRKHDMELEKTSDKIKELDKRIDEINKR